MADRTPKFGDKIMVRFRHEGDEYPAVVLDAYPGGDVVVGLGGDAETYQMTPGEWRWPVGGEWDDRDDHDQPTGYQAKEAP